jgi:solute carrier family 25 S-adenosylmethionine transporter 26
MYEFFKIRLAKSLDRPIGPHEAAVCGSVAGGIAAAVTTPLDVLKTRIMLDMKVSNTSPSLLPISQCLP